MKKTKKQLATLGLAVILASSMSMTSFAGQWQQDTTGWWYQNDDGSYFNGGWQWIEGKCYYFTPEGYCLINTTTPDGYTVDGSGAWIVNGAVQKQEMDTITSKHIPTSEEIVAHLSVVTDAEIDLMNKNNILNGREPSYTKESLVFLEVDYEKEPVISGITNVRLKGKNMWKEYPTGWYWQMYYRDVRGYFLCALAIDENGYLYVNTTTPDGFYVNEYGMLEIDGRTVVHTDDCDIFPPVSHTSNVLTYRDGTVVTDRNHADLSRIDGVTYLKMGIDNYMGYPLLPFGDLVYNHLEFVENGENGYIYSYGQGFGNCVQEAEARWKK